MKKRILTILLMLIVVLGVSSPVCSAASKPGKPIITSAKISGTSVTLKWKKVKGANGYQVYMGLAGDNLKKVKTLSKQEYTAKNLSPDERYSFKVRAYVTKKGKKVYGKYSKVKSVSIPIPTPAAPKNLTAKPTARGTVLTWEDSSGADMYYIERCYNKAYHTSEDCTMKLIGTSDTTSFIDTGVIGGKYYKYIVYGKNTLNGKTAKGPESEEVKSKAVTISQATEFSTNLEGGTYYMEEESVTFSASSPGEITCTTGNKNVVSLSSSRTDNGKDITMTFKHTGNAKITVKDDEGNEKAVYVSVENYTPKYSYEIKFFSKPYTDMPGLVYVKTDNPDGSLFVAATGASFGVGAEDYHLADIDYIDEKSGKVAGGYICSGTYSENTNATIGVFETASLHGKEIMVRVLTETVPVADTDAEGKEWMQSVVNSLYVDGMTKSELMKEIADYILANSIYLEYFKDGNIVKRSCNVGLPNWKKDKMRLNSGSSPKLLVEFGNIIGYPVKSLYNEYDENTPEWEQWHYYVKSEEDGSMYECCPIKGLGIERDSVEKLNLETYDFWTPEEE